MAALEIKKRTITEIRASKSTGEKMVYMSVPDYTSAKWAEMAHVDVAVVGDSLAMVAHGHPSTIPATMDMMVLHALAVRRGAPNTFVLGCMPYQSYNTVDRALTNATRFMQEALCDAVKPQGGKSQAHILKALVDAGIPTASHIGLTHDRHVRRLQDPGPHGRGRDEDPRGCLRDPGRRLLHAGVRGGPCEDRTDHQ
jgi:3-methyl-2-oxobutanoate hydroxymethyltransferase